MKTSYIIIIFISLLLAGCKDKTGDQNKTENNIPSILEVNKISEFEYSQLAVKNDFILGVQDHDYYLKNCFTDENFQLLNYTNDIQITDFQITNNGLFILGNYGKNLVYFEWLDNNYEFKWEITTNEDFINFGNYITQDSAHTDEIILAGTVKSIHSTTEKPIVTAAIVKVNESKNTEILCKYDSFKLEDLDYTFTGNYGIQAIFIDNRYSILYKIIYDDYFSTIPTYLVQFDNDNKFLWNSNYISGSVNWIKGYKTDLHDYIVLTETYQEEYGTEVQYFVSFINSSDGFTDFNTSYHSAETVDVLGAFYKKENKFDVLSIKKSSPNSYDLDSFDHYGTFLENVKLNSEYKLIKHSLMVKDNEYFLIGTKNMNTYLLKIKM